MLFCYKKLGAPLLVTGALPLDNCYYDVPPVAWDEAAPCTVCLLLLIELG